MKTMNNTSQLDTGFRHNKIWIFEIAGVAHAPYKEAIEAGIHEGAKLTLIPEPENPYDNKAIRIEWNGYKLGYVPRKQEGLQESISEEFLQKYSCVLSSFNPEGSTWKMFTVVVESNPLSPNL